MAEAAAVDNRERLLRAVSYREKAARYAQIAEAMERRVTAEANEVTLLASIDANITSLQDIPEGPT